MVTGFEVAGLPEAHRTLDVSSHVTTSPLTGTYVNSALLVPAFTLLTFHWYAGETPPFVGVAVKVTGVPPSTSVADAAIETLTGRLGVTVIIRAVDVLLRAPDVTVLLNH